MTRRSSQRWMAIALPIVAGLAILALGLVLDLALDLLLLVVPSSSFFPTCLDNNYYPVGLASRSIRSRNVATNVTDFRFRHERCVSLISIMVA